MTPPRTPGLPAPSPGRVLERLWYGRSAAGTLLAPLGWLFGAGVRLRRGAYRTGLIRPWQPPVPLVVVGNITVGGTGKTPVVAWLVNWLRAEGYRPGIVARGYGGTVGRGPRRVEPGDEARVVGDEPLLLRRETGVPVWVGADRVAAARELLGEPVDIIVSDDGLQHYRLGRTLELAVLDGQRRLGNGRLLPAGPLREPAGRLRDVHAVLVNGGTPGSGETGFRVTGTVARLPDGSGERALAGFADQPVRLLAGIGNPARFRDLLARHGVVPGAQLPVDDHGRVPEDLLQSPGPPILMTAKDAVKYRLPADGRFWVVPVAVEMSPGFGPWLRQRLPPPGR